MRDAAVEAVWAKGFGVGPTPSTSCITCGHHWGSHRLHPVTENPIAGGTWSCPEVECTCFGTWDVPMPDALREAVEERIIRRHE